MALDTPVQYLKGVGPKLAKALVKLNIHTVYDLFFHFPIRYVDRSRIQKIDQVKPGEQVVCLARVISVSELQFRGGRKVFQVLFGDGAGHIMAKWFYYYKQSFLKRYAVGKAFLIAGQVSLFRHQLQMVHPDCKNAEELGGEGGEVLPPGILAVYPTTEGLRPQWIARLVVQNLNQYLKEVLEVLPDFVRERYALPRLPEALAKVHQPSGSDLTEAFLNQQSPYHHRLIFEEFFYFQLALLQKRQGLKIVPGIAFEHDLTLVQQFLKLLPFELTVDQWKAFEEMAADMTAPKPMHRLLQGDVGSGKTVVALLATLLAYQNGYQVALMVPTEILAEQHYKNWVRFLSPLSITPYLLTSNTSKLERGKILSLIKNSTAHIVIGTHSLIEDEVEFAKLGLVIIDEQHRFGVEQRSRLMKKGKMPDVLVMTATPIPRSLAMTVYGDLDLSVMRHLPKGRQPIMTRVISEKKRPQLYQWLSEQFAKGRQAYVIYPLVEESEALDLKDAETAYKNLRLQFSGWQVGLLHGQMVEEEKTATMDGFVRNKIQLLVATTVVEVGVDVANATVMLIEHAERFGLSQLHQLRGRVGRGEHASYCFLLPDYKQSTLARERLQMMILHGDGFRIAEEDLRIRGPGDFLGTRQSGLPEFRMANLVRDVEILQQARIAAAEILAQDPQLENHRNLQQKLSEVFSSRNRLAQVG